MINPTNIDSGVESGRVPPQALDAERSVLAAMCLSREAVARAMEILDATSFYRETHRKIWNAIVTMFERDEAVDLITLRAELQRRAELEAVGGATYLAELFQSLVNPWIRKDFQRGRTGRQGHRVARQGSGLVDAAQRSQLLHVFFWSGQGAHRHAPADDLSETGQIR